MNEEEIKYLKEHPKEYWKECLKLRKIGREKAKEITEEGKNE